MFYNNCFNNNLIPPRQELVWSSVKGVIVLAIALASGWLHAATAL